MPPRVKEDVIALNVERIGHRYPPYRYEVSREKIREYAEATGVTDPAYRDDRSDLVAPPTFAACFTVVRGAAALFTDSELGAHHALVHGSQEFEWHRPLRPGDTLECTPWITAITGRGGNEFLTLQVDCADADTGEAVVTSRETLVFFAQPAGEAP